MNLFWALLPFIRRVGAKASFTRDFLYIWERISWLERIGSTLFPFALVLLFAFVIPLIGAPLIQKMSGSESSNFKVRFLVPETKLVNVEGEFELEIPKVMRVSETKPVNAKVTLGEGNVNPWIAMATLNSPSFTITPSDSEATVLSSNTLSWGWLITPKQVGDHAVSLSIEDANFTMVTDGTQRGLQVQGQSLVALITVLTDLGITSRQAAALKALGALLGIIGTILAYPIWKALFEKRVIRSQQRRRENPATKRKFGRSRLRR